ncbi:MAG: Minf_1886 family protein [Planctomycetaceae bacterium]
MSAEKSDSILRIVRRDGRYSPQAYYFIFDALDYTIQRMKKVRHVTGRELLEGIRLYATEHFGFLARTVLAEWGVNETSDFGELVFNLVEAGLLSRTDSDTKSDFQGIYEFGEAFDREFKSSLKDVKLAP